VLVSVRLPRGRELLLAAAIVTVLIGTTFAGSAEAQTPGCLPTVARTIGPHGFPGLGVKRVAPVYTDALQYSLGVGYKPGEAQNEASALNAEGFVSGTSQLYFGRKRKTRGDEGLSFTTQLGSPEGATAEFNRILQKVFRNGPWKTFTVPSIPGSRGVLYKYRGTGASNVYFADGNYFYGVGRYVAKGGSGAGEVIRAATKLFQRVHGAPVC
jgi:hypothetical protein